MISLEGLFFPAQWVAFETCCEEFKKGKGAAWERGGEGWEGSGVGGVVGGWGCCLAPGPPLLQHWPWCCFSLLHPTWQRGTGEQRVTRGRGTCHRCEPVVDGAGVSEQKPPPHFLQLQQKRSRVARFSVVFVEVWWH